MAGAVQSVLVCVEAAETVSPCPAGQAPALIPSYLVDPGSSSLFDLATAPIDPVSMGEFWAVGFGFVLGSYLLSRVVGAVLEVLRH